MWTNVKAAYANWWGQIAMLFSALSIFSYLTRALHLGVAHLFGELLATYRALFHPIVDALTGIVQLSFTDWQKDALLVWLAIGGATSRTFFIEFVSAARDPHYYRDGSGTFRDLRWGALGWALSAFVAWPVGWFELFRAPHFERVKLSDGVWLYTRVESPSAEDNPVGQSPEEYVCDLRVVLAIQMATIAAVVVMLTLINAAMAG
jgi:hypothetical protein